MLTKYLVRSYIGSCLIDWFPMKQYVVFLGGASALVLAATAGATIVSRAAPLVATKTAIIVVPPPTALPSLAPVPAAAPIAKASPMRSTAQDGAMPASVTSAAAALPPLDLTEMQLWNWNAKWTASEWANPNAPIPWRYNHITQVNRADTIFRLDANGAPELQAVNGTPAHVSGMWETDVTLPKLKDGLIVAPLWVYDATSRDEIDFEFAGRKGLDVSLHSVIDGKPVQNTVRLFAGVDMSGRRKRFGIKVNQTAGFIEMYVDTVRVYRWDRATAPFFVSRPLKPWIEMWPAITSNSGFVQWAGKWQGLAAGETLSMTVHGYAYKPLMP
jgi:hypothetical protein